MKLVDRINKKIERIRNFFYLYITDLDRKEIDQLLKKDAVHAFSYLQNRTSAIDQAAIRPSLKSVLHAGKEIFIGFIMRLTPARRFFYGNAILAFLIGWIASAKFYLLGSFIILNILIALELVDKLTTRDELEIAREIQLSLRPFSIPVSKFLSIATYSRPAKLVGGDFFDIVQPDSDHIIGIVGDVSDKGISAALYAAYVQSMFQSFSGTTVSPSNIFYNINRLISERLRDGDFITAVIASFDLKEKSVTIARAGHNWPLYYCSNSKRITELKPKGVSIGLCENEQFCASLEEQKLFLNHDDFLLLYSDGVTEAQNPQNVLFDLSGLKQTITESAQESSEILIDRINYQLHRFVDSDELQDDATMIAVKVI